MDPFTVMQRRGHLLPEESGFTVTKTHSGPNDDYDLASGPSRSLTARSDKAMHVRDFRMPVDLTRSRRVGLSRNVCYDCRAVIGETITRHAVTCRIAGSGFRQRETTGPMLANQTSADVGWR